MNDPENEDGGPLLAFELPEALSELLISYVRQQESDLRMLEILEAQIESPKMRDARIAAELRTIDPRVDAEQVREMVAQVTDLYFTNIARGDPLEEILEATHDLVASLTATLVNDVDGTAFASALMRACADEPDSSRMRTNVLMGAVAGFEGVLLTVARLLAVANPEWLLQANPPRRHKLASTVTVTDRDSAADVQILVERKTMGGWRETCKAFAALGIKLPNRPEIMRVASEARNAAAHRNGALRETLALVDGGGATVEVDLATDLTAALLRDLLDRQIVYLLDVALLIHERFESGDAAKAGRMLGAIQYELLKRGRNHAGAATAHFHRRVRFESDGDRKRSQVNGWLALHRLGRQGEYRRELDGWGSTVGGTTFELAGLVLTNRHREARRRAETLRRRGLLSERDWQTWPLFDAIRDGPDDREAGR